MTVDVEFNCVGCDRLLLARSPLRGDLLWPQSYRWTCRGCEDGYRYILFLRCHTLCYSVCPCDAKGRLLPGMIAIDVPFRVVADNSEAGTSDKVGRRSGLRAVCKTLDVFSQRHAAVAGVLVPRLLAHLAPANPANTCRLNADLTASTTHGAFAELTTVGFQDAGARTGYVQQRLISRSRQLGSICLNEPIASLLKQAGEDAQAAIRVASVGGGPGECALAFSICRAVLETTTRLEVALLDLEPGWQICAENLASELQSLNYLTPLDNVWFGGADVTHPIDSEANASICPGSQWDVVIFSYVLVENLRRLRESGFQFLRGVFAALRGGACCVFLDSTRKFHNEVATLACEFGLQGASAEALAQMPGNCLILTRPI